MYNNIAQYVTEKLKINKDLKEIDTIDEKDFQTYVNDCKKAAAEKGLTVTFRNKKALSGDFTFFIYDKSKQNRYLIGYDGSWGFENSFKRCYEDTLAYIESYKP